VVAELEARDGEQAPCPRIGGKTLEKGRRVADVGAPGSKVVLRPGERDARAVAALLLPRGLQPLHLAASFARQPASFSSCSSGLHGQSLGSLAYGSGVAGTARGAQAAGSRGGGAATPSPRRLPIAHASSRGRRQR
jgi:hypothetical protein